MGLVAVARDLADLRERLGRITDRPDVRGRAGHRRAAQGGRLDGGPAEGRDQAEPRPDARGAARVRPLRAVREHRARQQLARRRPRRRSSSASTSSPSRASRRTWGWRSSSTSRAGSAACGRAPSCSSRPCARSSTTAATSTAGWPRSRTGAANLARHIGIIRHFGLQAVVGVNKFPTDTQEELELVKRLAVEHGAYAAEVNTAFEDGGKGADRARRGGRRGRGRAVRVPLRLPYDAPIEEKIRAIATNVYGADGVFLLKTAKDKAAAFEAAGLGAPADLHGEDAPLALARRDAAERADGVHRHRARPAALHRRRLDRRAVRRHADDARPRARRPPRTRSTSTRTATPSACSELVQRRSAAATEPDALRRVCTRLKASPGAERRESARMRRFAARDRPWRP